jgi:lysophospholipase L1-like esterase
MLRIFFGAMALCLVSIQSMIMSSEASAQLANAHKSTAAEQPRVLHYLALGDSYTIGESVPIYESFPYQAVQLMRKTGLNFAAPEIIARTGWTTDELQAGIRSNQLLKEYDFVSLLIGVNNQYRGRTTENYAPEFEALLKQAIAFAGGKKERVVVLSIPDWSATPFAEGRDRSKIASEIDAYNAVNKRITLQWGVHYIDITPGTREALQDKLLVAKDGLHPSGKDYGRWAAAIAQYAAGQSFQ